ncbi:hypothetical protein PAGA_a1548 [Pseudoalteromonas agarivorans DSM 14585]|uniref:Uncharacterized protein n=1 Tax=Pseudoalteromonas agarivorans DSM 14585 TaxID=1312369 RepID=A0ACA8DUT6_9GAMM|nr:hypothetical protein PAGA_a1548 [Pseudoalteromonas agarivorans DSM 14585]
MQGYKLSLSGKVIYLLKIKSGVIKSKDSKLAPCLLFYN